MFKKTAMAGLVAAALGSGLAQAQAPAAPASPHTLTGNMGLYSQYIFRGLTQTNGDPALQGGFDYSHSSGFYAGTWASNISWLKENAMQPNGAEIGMYGRGGSLEWDFYGGYKWSLPNDLTLDLGTLYYFYPGDIGAAYTALWAPGTNLVKADTWEAYAGLSWKWLSAKFSYSLNNKTFTVADSKGTYYLDLTANFPVTDKLTLNAHWGMQKYSGTDLRNAAPGGVIRNNDDVYSYSDYKLGLSYAMPKDFTVGAFYSKATSADVCGYGAYTQVGNGCTGPYPKDIGKGTGTVFVAKTF